MWSEAEALARLPFREVWLADFEYGATNGNRPVPRCLVALELRTNRLLRFWHDELISMKRSPYAIDADALFIAYYASAEFTCHLALGWELPVHVLDLFVAFRKLTNGLAVPCGNGLLGALTYFGLAAMDVAEKQAMRELALRGAHTAPTNARRCSTTARATCSRYAVCSHRC